MSNPKDHAERCVPRTQDVFDRSRVVEIVAKAIKGERAACIDAIPDGFDGPFMPEEQNVAFRAGLDAAEAAIRER